jgi:intracellular multiplication protein IcmL
MQESNDIDFISRELSRFNSFFYRDRFRLLAAILPLLVFLAIALIIANAYIYLTTVHEPTKFYASNMYNGTVTPVIPLSQPTANRNQILSLVNTNVISFFTFNFANYQDALNSAQKEFTPNGWKDFYNFWQSSAILNDILTQQLFVSAVADGPSVLLSDGAINGHYAWNISVPIIATFANKDNSQQYQRRFDIEVTVIRVPNIDNDAEVAFDSFLVKPKT